MFCWPLRMTMSSALPSMIACTNRPRWLRDDCGRSQSATGHQEEQPDDADHEQEQPLPGHLQPEHRQHEVDQPGHQGRRARHRRRPRTASRRR